MANTQKVDVWELGTLFVTMLTGGTQPWTDANSADAKKIWEEREKSQRDSRSRSSLRTFVGFWRIFLRGRRRG